MDIQTEHAEMIVIVESDWVVKRDALVGLYDWEYMYAEAMKDFYARTRQNLEIKW